MCDCIIKTEEKLKEKYLKPEIDIVIDFLTGKAMPKMSIIHHGIIPKEKKKEQKILLLPTFCPFCGQKYEVNKDVKNVNVKRSLKQQQEASGHSP